MEEGDDGVCFDLLLFDIFGLGFGVGVGGRGRGGVEEGDAEGWVWLDLGSVGWGEFGGFGMTMMGVNE